MLLLFLRERGLERLVVLRELLHRLGHVLLVLLVGFDFCLVRLNRISNPTSRGAVGASSTLRCQRRRRDRISHVVRREGSDNVGIFDAEASPPAAVVRGHHDNVTFLERQVPWLLRLIIIDRLADLLPAHLVGRHCAERSTAHSKPTNKESAVTHTQRESVLFPAAASHHAPSWSTASRLRPPLPHTGTPLSLQASLQLLEVICPALSAAPSERDRQSGRACRLPPSTQRLHPAQGTANSTRGQLVGGQLVRKGFQTATFNPAPPPLTEDCKTQRTASSWAASSSQHRGLLLLPVPIAVAALQDRRRARRIDRAARDVSPASPLLPSRSNSGCRNS